MSEQGRLQDYSVDQAAGAVVLVLGAVASLLLVVWQSKCHCKINLCYLFQCERRPPSEEEMKSLKDQAKEMKDKKDKKNKKEEQGTPRLIPKKSNESHSVPEPEPEIDNLV